MTYIFLRYKARQGAVSSHLLSEGTKKLHIPFSWLFGLASTARQICSMLPEYIFSWLPGRPIPYLGSNNPLYRPTRSPIVFFVNGDLKRLNLVALQFCANKDD